VVVTICSVSETCPRVFSVTAARHCPPAAGAVLGGIRWLPLSRVLALSAYATKMGRSLVPANQHKLGLSATDLVVLINLTMQWWYRDRLPFPKSATIAKRMGASVRTVQRSLNRLEKLALVEKIPLGQRRAFDPSALVERLIFIAQHDPAFRLRLRAPEGRREVQALPSA
jgi:hypothetical protein